ncbi:GFA family protein [Loktanella sp. IMCC34160]|uniref:GFA family protein n=1 Tax=Loktanella sp. IMCC34160 TaxID=2510646 RepID=UPI00101BFB7B|nr:GFA family protein [Loktanella sp. IMCC34160]RYG91136.1 GFA family protein [Loktanella sp. IMCC34160]
MKTGSCLCGSVAFSFPDGPEKVTACHCSQCRKTSGHVWAAFHVPLADLTFSRDGGLSWFESSDWAKRGFCNTCGSSLFYQMKGEATINIAAGAVDEPTGLTLTRHIFVADKGDYYSIGADGADQIEKY